MDRPRQTERVEVSQVPDGYVLYDERRDRVHYLNHTAVLVFELCTGENSVDEIVAILQKTYDLSEPPEAETLAYLDQLRQEGLIR